MAGTLADKWPVLGRHEQAAEWLGIWVDLGRAPRTVDAYARGLAEYLDLVRAGGCRTPGTGLARRLASLGGVANGQCVPY